MELEKLFSLGLIKLMRTDKGFILIFDVSHFRNYLHLKCLVMLNVAGDRIRPAVPYVSDRHADGEYFFRPAHLQDARPGIRVWRPKAMSRVFNTCNYAEDLTRILKETTEEYFDFQDEFNNNGHIA